MSDQELIRQLEAISDGVLVEKLWNGDDDAWRYVLIRSVAPVLKRPALAAIMKDRQRSEMDVLGALFERLVGKKALRNFQFKCPLICWIRYWVAKEVYEYCEKNDAPVSDEAYLAVLNDSAAPKSNRDRLEEANECFKRLYRESKVKAKVLYLRTVEGRSAREVMSLLKLSSEDNVNQLFARACKAMRGYRDELQRPARVERKEVACELS